jgi:hypothetical protein
MLEHYFTALMSLGRTPDHGFSALPDAAVQPERKGRKTGRTGPSQRPASRASTVQQVALADPPLAAGPTGSIEWDPCPCRVWGVLRSDRHGCAPMLKELFPQLDHELDAWEAEHGWLYR